MAWQVGEEEVGEGSREKQCFQTHLEDPSDGGQGTAGQEGGQEAGTGRLGGPRRCGADAERRARRGRGREAGGRHCTVNARNCNTGSATIFIFQDVLITEE